MLARSSSIISQAKESDIVLVQVFVFLFEKGGEWTPQKLCDNGSARHCKFELRLKTDDFGQTEV